MEVGGSGGVWRGVEGGMEGVEGLSTHFDAYERAVVDKTVNIDVSILMEFIITNGRFIYIII